MASKGKLRNLLLPGQGEDGQFTALDHFQTAQYVVEFLFILLPLMLWLDFQFPKIDARFWNEDDSEMVPDE